MSKKYSFLIQAKHVFDGKQKSTYEGFLCLKDKQIVKMGKGKASQKIQEEAEEILLKYCSKHVAKYAMPSSIQFRDNLPKTLVGKVAYRILEEEELKKYA